MRGLLVLLALAPAEAVLSRSKLNPVSGVVTLIENLVKNLQKDAETEQSLFSDFECWCTRTETDLGKRVTDNSAERDNIKAQIDELKAMLARYEAGDEAGAAKNEAADGSVHYETDEHERHQAKIMKLKNELKELEGHQTEAQNNYDQARDEFDSAITALGTAADQTKPAEGGFINFSTKVRLALEKGAATLSNEDDVEMVDKMMLMSKAEPVNSKFSDANYTPEQQQKVNRLINRIKGQFELERKQLNLNYYGNEAGDKDDSAEKGEYINFVNLVANKKEEIQTTTDAMNMGAEEKAAKELKLKGLEAQHEALVDGIEEDNKIISDAKSECETKTTLHNTNMENRNSEIAGLHKVMEFLNDPDNRDKTLKAYEFVQISESKQGVRKVAVHKAAHTLQRAAAKSGDHKMAVLAQTAEDADLQEVIQACRDMIADLKTDQAQDKTDLDDYTDTRTTAAKDAKGKAIEIDDLNAKITNKQNLIATKEEEQASMRDQMQMMVEELNTAQDVRNKENRENAELEQSYTQGAEVVAKAVTMMAEVWGPAALIQADPDRTAGDKKNPGFEPTEYGGAAGDKTTISETLSMIQGNLEKSAQTTRDEEAESETAFNSYKDDMKERMNACADGVYAEWESNGVTSLKDYDWSSVASGTYFDAQDAIDTANADIETAKGDRTAAKDAMDGFVKSIKDISEQADFLAIHFDTRKANRDAEIEGLNKCIDFLSNAENVMA